MNKIPNVAYMVFENGCLIGTFSTYGAAFRLKNERQQKNDKRYLIATYRFEKLEN